MTSRKELLNNFLYTYYGTETHSGFTLALSAAVKKHIQNIRTIVVDVAHLSNGVVSINSTWTIASTDPLKTAAMATVATKDPLRGALAAALPESAAPTQPIKSFSGRIDYCSWYLGDKYEVYAAGSISRILHLCDLTENERELILLESRRLSSSGQIAFATASGILSNPDPAPGTMTFDGLVICNLQIYEGTQAAVEGLRKLGIDVILMTSEPEDMATLIARAGHILKRATGARNAKYASTDHQVFSNVTRQNARKILRKLNPEVIVARHTLVELFGIIKYLSR